MESTEGLAAVAAAVRGCRACRLGETRANPVPGAGAADTGVVFVGEAPGRVEDGCGEPFVGACGRLLDRMLDDVGLAWRRVGYVLPVVKCRPPGNRDPRADEVAACRQHLVGQLAALRPGVVVTLGRFGLAAFRPGATVADNRGRWVAGDGWPGALALGPYALFPVCHPAAALRFPRWRAALAADLATLAATLPAVRAEVARARDRGGAVRLPLG